jgi:hypothetical protein
MLDHIMWGMQHQESHHVQGSYVLGMTVLSQGIGLGLKTRKRLSGKFIE